MRQYERAAQELGCWMRERAVDAGRLSRLTGIDAGTLRHILSGRRRAISTRNMLALARFFGVSLGELMDKLS